MEEASGLLNRDATLKEDLGQVIGNVSHTVSRFTAYAVIRNAVDHSDDASSGEVDRQRVPSKIVVLLARGWEDDGKRRGVSQSVDHVVEGRHLFKLLLGAIQQVFRDDCLEVCLVGAGGQIVPEE